MILKSCIGNRSLGWDLLPPGSERLSSSKDKAARKSWRYAGYKETPHALGEGYRAEEDQLVCRQAVRRRHCQREDRCWPNSTSTTPARRSTRSRASSSGRATRTATTPDTPAATSRTSCISSSSCARTSMLPTRSSSAPPSVRPRKGATGNEGKILEAQLAVDGKTGKYPEFKGNVATVYSHPLVHRRRVQQPLRRQCRNLHERRRSHGQGHGGTAKEQDAVTLIERDIHEYFILAVSIRHARFRIPGSLSRGNR